MTAPVVLASANISCIINAAIVAENLSSLQEFGTFKRDELLHMDGKEWAHLIGRLIFTLLRNDPTVSTTSETLLQVDTSIQTLSSWKSIKEVMNSFESYLRPYGVISFADMFCAKTEGDDLSPEERLDLLLRFSSALQQQRLEFSKLVSSKVCKKDLAHEIDNDSMTGEIKMPAHFTEKQRRLVMMYHDLLRADYVQRLKWMYQRLNILETDYGIPNTMVQTSLVPTVLSSLDDLKDKLSTPASTSGTGSKLVPSKIHLSNHHRVRTDLPDRGGRLDDKDRRLPAAAAWNDGGRDPEPRSRCITHRQSRPRNRGSKAKK